VAIKSVMNTHHGKFEFIDGHQSDVTVALNRTTTPRVNGRTLSIEVVRRYVAGKLPVAL